MDLALLLLVSTPLILAGLGELIGQRSGVINIGLEGTMLMGSLVGFWIAGASGSLISGFAAAAIAGALLSLISGVFTIRYGADQVVVGTAINFLALGVTGLAFRRIYGQSGQLLASAELPRFFGVDAIVWLTFFFIPFVWFLIARTNWGLVVRGCGEFPKAVDAAGFSVSGIRFQAGAVAGALAGLGGAHLALGVAGSFAEGMTAGRGFLAIALVTFGRWRPVWVATAAILLGYAQSLQYSLQGKPVLGVQVPSQLWLALPYVLALIVLVVLGTGTVTPQALGKAYTKER